jgi:ABC-type amino acid transport substrate-binding protein
MGKLISFKQYRHVKNGLISLLLAYLSGCCELVFAASENADKETLIFGCISPAHQVDTRFVDSIIRPVVAGHGYDLRYEHLSGGELVSLHRKGALAGSCGRAPDFNETTGLKLVRIDPAFRRAKFGLWGNKKNYEKFNQRRERLRVGIRTDVPYITRLAKEMGLERLSYFSSVDSAVKALEGGAIDALLAYEASISSIETANEPLELLDYVVSFPAHVYVGEQYRSLVPKLSAAIEKRIQMDAYDPYPEITLPEIKPNQIIFGCPIPDDSPAFKHLAKAFGEAFNILGYDFKMVSLPRARDVAALVTDKIDGSCGRMDIPPFNQDPNLLRLEVVSGSFSVKVVSTKPRELIRSLDDLERGSRIGFIRGTKLSADMVSSYPHLSAVGLTSSDIGIKMLAAGRIDYLADVPVTIDYLLKKININKKIYVVSDFPDRYFYAYLRSRHRALKKPLEDYLNQKLKSDNHNTMLDGLQAH